MARASLSYNDTVTARMLSKLRGWAVMVHRFGDVEVHLVLSSSAPSISTSTMLSMRLQQRLTIVVLILSV